MQRLLPALLWLLVCPSTGWAQDGGKAVRPEIKVGDMWKYRITDSYTRLMESESIEVTGVTEDRIHTRSARSTLGAPGSPAAGGMTEVWDRNWNQLRRGDTEFTPYYPILRFPLEPGASWSGAAQWYSGSGTLKHQITAQAGGWERVVVPAGSFDAIRIDVRGAISETGSLNYYAQAGSISSVYWYAPAAGRIVKKQIVHRDNTPIGLGNLAEQWELLEYKRN